MNINNSSNMASNNISAASPTGAAEPKLIIADQNSSTPPTITTVDSSNPATKRTTELLFSSSTTSTKIDRIRADSSGEIERGIISIDTQSSDTVEVNVKDGLTFNGDDSALVEIKYLDGKNSGATEKFRIVLPNSEKDSNKKAVKPILEIVTGNGNDKVDVEPKLNHDMVIRTRGGNDRILTSGGNDKIFSGNGNDNIEAGNGKDYIDAGNGSDVMNGNIGDDIIYASTGNDTVISSSGSDYIDLGPGNDFYRYNQLISSSGGTITPVDSNNDIISGGDGNDTFEALDSSDLVISGNGADVINSISADSRPRIIGQRAEDSTNTGSQKTPDALKNFINDTPIQSWNAAPLSIVGSPEFKSRVQDDLTTLASLPLSKDYINGISNAPSPFKIQIKELDSLINNGYALPLEPFTFIESTPEGNVRGKGSASDVSYNPSFYANGLQYPIVTLYHELIHSYNFSNGRDAPGNNPPNGPNRELQTVGLPLSADALKLPKEMIELKDSIVGNPLTSLTENGLRSTLGAPLRPSYLGIDLTLSTT